MKTILNNIIQQFESKEFLNSSLSKLEKSISFVSTEIDQAQASEKNARNAGR
jgi:hypothetical protein